MTDSSFQRFAAELAHDPVAVETLLARHIPDERGMCMSCTTGGTGGHDTSWPCSLHTLATTARGRLASS